jgi:hypothetical protein
MLGAFLEHVEFVAGLGNQVRFWHDRWCGETPLKDLFPPLFVCSSHCDASIQSLLVRTHPGGKRVWNISFVCDFNDCEIEDVLSFLNLIQSHIPSEKESNVLMWIIGKNGLFDTCSFYSVLRGPIEPRFPWKSIWGVKAPKRVSFFVWTTAWGNILTCDNLMRRSFVMAGWCCICRRDWETGDHLLIHCIQFLI